ncbi:MAG: hypothetical protein AUJ96_17370 [Armatimonadetes bacterium CG2_30_66_41]|nr:hypothetical protein [Armatimonadota bacterium]NCQ28383.1 hypothetical protein [Armatimonadota bacterium]OIP01498.1 MAG: hypothetical protein AUJ96_17370 [Armatimonadetes bacterium CG2_30_66_41]PIU92063.1 MAG: hypothetical protein COS65_19820 [Armatimonadetes bacterium CG06_land_8_20_14_3_00_66_21]
MSERLQKAFPSLIGFLAFFSAFYLYVWLRYDLRQLYDVHALFPAFLKGRAFFEPFALYPGGPAEYAAAFLAQSCYRPWASALVLTGMAAALTLLTRAFWRAAGGGRDSTVPYVSAVLVLMAHGRFACYFAELTSLLVAGGGAAAYASLRRVRPELRLAVFVLSAPLVHYVAGGADLLYALLCGMLEILVSGQRLLGLFCLLWAEVVPYVAATYVFGVERLDSYARLLPYQRDTDQALHPWLLALYLYFPLAVLIACWRTSRQLSVLPAEGADAGGKSGKPRPDSRLRHRLRSGAQHPLLQRLFCAALAAAAVWGAFDRTAATRYRIDWEAHRHQWAAVLADVAPLPAKAYTFSIAHNLNRALYETGQLPSRMFAYPQDLDTLLIGLEPRIGTTHVVRMGAYFQAGDLDLQMGLVNEADHWAHEALGRYGPRPVILMRLARVSLARGQSAAARVFLRALTKDLFWGRRAARLLQRLEQDPLLSRDSGLRRIRALMLGREAGDLWVSLEKRCRDLLARNPHNRMAFEYLMAYYLSQRDLKHFAANLSRLKDIRYAGIPRHYEEAVLIYEAGSGDRADLGGREVSARTTASFEGFVGTYNQFIRLGPASAQQALRETHGDTYFFYYYLGGLGAIK